LSYFLNRRVVTQQQAYEEPKTNSLSQTSLNLVDGGTIQVLAGHQYNLQCVVPEVSTTPPPVTPTQSPVEKEPPITDFKVNSDREYKWVYRPQVGDKYYTDSDYVLTTLPPRVTDGDYWMLMTPNKDKSNKLDNLISFKIKHGRVYVQMEYHLKNQGTKAPSWIETTMGVNRSGIKYDYCVPEFRESMCCGVSNPSGPLTLIPGPTIVGQQPDSFFVFGGNRAEGSSDTGENYIIFLTDFSPLPIEIVPMQ